MKTYIALFRGINVGGKHALPMKELMAILEGLGAQTIKTYIQSGNAVFASQEQDHCSFQKREYTCIHRSYRAENTKVNLITVNNFGWMRRLSNNWSQNGSM